MLSAGQKHKSLNKGVAGLRVSGNRNRPPVSYQFMGTKPENEELLNNAFDVLFEEVLKNEDLTAIDN